jgi:hypothetical protein
VQRQRWIQWYGEWCAVASTECVPIFIEGVLKLSERQVRGVAVLGPTKRLPGRCTQSEGRVRFLCGPGLGRVRRMAAAHRTPRRRDRNVQEQPGLLSPTRAAFFSDGQNPSRMPSTTPFSHLVSASIFLKPTVDTNSLIHMYCFHTPGLARASIVNIYWNWRTQMVA